MESCVTMWKRVRQEEIVQAKKYMNEGLNFASDALEQVVDLSLSLHVLCDLL